MEKRLHDSEKELSCERGCRVRNAIASQNHVFFWQTGFRISLDMMVREWTCLVV